jgi:hypothetical protein
MREQFDSQDAFIKSLHSELQQHIDDKTDDQLQLYVDVIRGRLIVRGTPAVHRYLSQRLSIATSQ